MKRRCVRPRWMPCLARDRDPRDPHRLLHSTLDDGSLSDPQPHSSRPTSCTHSHPPPPPPPRTHIQRPTCLTIVDATGSLPRLHNIDWLCCSGSSAGKYSLALKSVIGHSGIHAMALWQRKSAMMGGGACCRQIPFHHLPTAGE